MIYSCKRHNDCFTCPFDDCKAGAKTVTQVKREPSSRSEYWRQYYLNHREEILAKRKEHYRRKKEI